LRIKSVDERSENEAQSLYFHSLRQKARKTESAIDQKASFRLEKSGLHYNAMYKGFLSNLKPVAYALLPVVVIGALVPSLLNDSGFPPVLVASSVMAIFALVIDGVLTKVGLDRSAQEMNPVVKYLVKWFGVPTAIIATRLVGTCVILYGLLVARSAYLLLAFTWLLLALVLVNSISLLVGDSLSNLHIEKDSAYR